MISQIRELIEAFRAYSRVKKREEAELLEVINQRWKGVDYKITHRTWKNVPWELRFTGIELPKYDRLYDGPHNYLARNLFAHIIAKEINSEKPVAPGSFSGDKDRKKYNPLTQVPCLFVENLPEGNRIARNTIGSYLLYKPGIDQAIKEIERIYVIDPKTRRSEEWGINGPMHGEKIRKYPADPRDLIPVFKEQFKLDYLNEKLL